MTKELMSTNNLNIQQLLQPKSIRVRNYFLNSTHKIKAKIKDLERPTSMNPKDKGKQIHISFNTVTYEILAANIIEYLKAINIQVNSREPFADSSGRITDQQIIVQTQQNKNISLFITFYHTSTTMLIQSPSHTVTNQFWEQHFHPIIKVIESRTDFHIIKEFLREQMQNHTQKITPIRHGPTRSQNKMLEFTVFPAETHNSKETTQDNKLILATSNLETTNTIIRETNSTATPNDEITNHNQEENKLIKRK